jgi:hypothetical protein
LAVRRLFTQSSRRNIIYILIILVCLVVLDGVITEYIINGGSGSESNPFLESMIGEPGFMILKAAGALFCALVLYDVYHRWPRAAMAIACIAVVVYLGIVLWNTSLIFLT